MWLRVTRRREKQATGAFRLSAPLPGHRSNTLGPPGHSQVAGDNSFDAYMASVQPPRSGTSIPGLKDSGHNREEEEREAGEASIRGSSNDLTPSGAPTASTCRSSSSISVAFSRDARDIRCFKGSPPRLPQPRSTTLQAWIDSWERWVRAARYAGKFSLAETRPAGKESVSGTGCGVPAVGVWLANRACPPRARSLGSAAPPPAAHLVVPADDELQVAHELPERLVLGEQALGAVGNLFLLLEVQVLHLSENCHQLRRGQLRSGARVCPPLSLRPGASKLWGAGPAGRIRKSSPRLPILRQSAGIASVSGRRCHPCPGLCLGPPQDPVPLQLNSSVSAESFCPLEAGPLEGWCPSCCCIYWVRDRPHAT